MAGTGRGNKTPPDLRVLRNDKAHQHRYKDEDVEVRNPVSSLEPPETLAERAKEIFTETVALLDKEYQLCEADVNILVIYSNNQEQLEALEMYLRENNVTYEEETQWGYKVHKRPEVDIHEKCKNTAVKILESFKKLPKKKVGTGKANPFSAFSKTGNE